MLTSECGNPGAMVRMTWEHMKGRRLNHHLGDGTAALRTAKKQQPCPCCHVGAAMQHCTHVYNDVHSILKVGMMNMRLVP
jgi:hypothetical protein